MEDEKGLICPRHGEPLTFIVLTTTGFFTITCTWYFFPNVNFLWYFYTPFSYNVLHNTRRPYCDPHQQSSFNLQACILFFPSALVMSMRIELKISCVLLTCAKSEIRWKKHLDERPALVVCQDSIVTPKFMTLEPINKKYKPKTVKIKEKWKIELGHGHLVHNLALMTAEQELN